MGIGVSNWRLASAVSRLGQLGVVSGTAIDTVLVRRLQDGDPGGHMRRAMEHFPIPQVAAEALARYFQPGGRAPGEPYTLLPMYQQVVSRAREQFTMLAAFVEVYLAKEGHDGLVGINLLTKIQMPNLAVALRRDAGRRGLRADGRRHPARDPGRARRARASTSRRSCGSSVEGAAPGQAEYLRFDPAAHWEGAPPPVVRPRFLPIVASNSLATMLARKATGRVDGFVVEGPTAGGHNAPPRDRGVSNETGEPIYGAARRGGPGARSASSACPSGSPVARARPERLREALAAGAAGIQVGTLFAYCDESGLTDQHPPHGAGERRAREVRIRTDARASPTGFPFKVVSWDGDPAAGVARKRVCDLGYLRDAYGRGEKGIGYRCASEPEDQYVAKGGAADETPGRQCLCNALLATIGLGQVREDGAIEPPLLTSGDELTNLAAFLAGRTHYTAADVVRWLLGAPAA